MQYTNMIIVVFKVDSIKLDFWKNQIAYKVDLRIELYTKLIYKLIRSESWLIKKIWDMPHQQYVELGQWVWHSWAGADTENPQFGPGHCPFLFSINEWFEKTKIKRIKSPKTVE